MKNKLYKGTIGLFAAMLACGTILIGSPASVEAVLGDAGNISEQEGSDHENDKDNNPIILPQGDQDQATKVVE